ncbi:SHOCT domain-containing protein [Streptomyces sp. NPDC058685]|uniref:SHOCT domain-containing protein n=1 Tax=Streptomyces sp. NPDC058685 TaxID=3346598 RepID=UPI003663A27F
MQLAYDYPLLGAMWTILWISLWVLWFFLLFRIIGDIFRDDTLSGGMKTVWLLFVILLPFLGVFVYVVARGRGMGKREQKHAEEQKHALDEYIRSTAGGPSEVEQLAKLSEIRARGDISDAEFNRAKEKILH